MKNITRIELYNLCKVHKYLGLRESGGYLFAVNCRLVNLPTLADKVKSEPNAETGYISYIPISFNEYISIKPPFTISR